MESVMRHFLHLALSPGVLARGMTSGSPKGSLIACIGAMKRFTAPDRRTLSRAIDMAAITTPADPNLFGAPLAVEQPVVVLEQLAMPPLKALGNRGIKASAAVCLRVTVIPGGPGVLAKELAPGLRFFEPQRST